MDLSIAITGTTFSDALPAIEAIAALLLETGTAAEFLVLTESPQADVPGEVRSCPVRQIACSEGMYGAQLRAMRDACRGRWLITLDHPTKYDASLVFALWHRRGEGDLLVASRYAFGGSYEMPWLRRVLSRSLNRMYRSALSVPVRDFSSGRRMYRVSLLCRVPIEGEDYDVLMEVLLRYMSKGGRVVEVPWHYESTIYRQAPGTALRLVKSCLRTLFRMHALRNSVDFPDYDYRAFDSRIWLQRYWQRKRFEIIRGFTREPGRVLDIGCGSSRLVTTRPEMFALDININRLRFLLGVVPRRLQATAGALPFRDEEFDTVLTSQVIEHTSELNCVEEAARVCRTGGVVVVGTPDYGTFWWPVTERLYGLAKSGGYADEHITHYTRESLTREIERCGCRVDECRYVGGGELIVRATKLRHVPPGGPITPQDCRQPRPSPDGGTAGDV